MNIMGGWKTWAASLGIIALFLFVSGALVAQAWASEGAVQDLSGALNNDPGEIMIGSITLPVALTIVLGVPILGGAERSQRHQAVDSRNVWDRAVVRRTAVRRRRSDVPERGERRGRRVCERNIGNRDSSVDDENRQGADHEADMAFDRHPRGPGLGSLSGGDGPIRHGPWTCSLSARRSPPGRRTWTAGTRRSIRPDPRRTTCLSVFGDGEFSYRHSTDGGTFATDLLAGGTVGAEEKVGLNLLGAGGLSGNAFGSAAGFSMRGETLEMHSESEANDETLEYDVEASGDGRYQSEAYAEERLDVSEERMSDLLTNLHLDLCPFGESESGAEAVSREQYEYSESGSGVFSHSFSIRLGPTATQTTE